MASQSHRVWRWNAVRRGVRSGMQMFWVARDAAGRVLLGERGGAGVRGGWAAELSVTGRRRMCIESRGAGSVAYGIRRVRG